MKHWRFIWILLLLVSLVSGFAKVNGYGPVVGYQASPLTLNTRLYETLTWRSRLIDPSGYYYLGSRYYDPLAGRFLSADPLGHAGSLDLYSFCNGDPINRFDPTGRFGKGAVAAIGDALDFSGGPSYASMMNVDQTSAAMKLGYQLTHVGIEVGEQVALIGLTEGVGELVMGGVEGAEVFGGVKFISQESELSLDAGKAAAGDLTAMEAPLGEMEQTEFSFAKELDAEAVEEPVLTKVEPVENTSATETAVQSTETETALGSYQGQQIELLPPESPKVGDGEGRVAQLEQQQQQGMPVANGSSGTPEGTTIAQNLSAAANRATQIVGPGKGRVYGTQVHTAFQVEVKALGLSGLRTEVSYMNGVEVDYGTPGSVRIDVGQYGANGQIQSVFDLKTGSAKLTPARIQQIQQAVGSPIPVIVIRP